MAGCCSSGIRLSSQFTSLKNEILITGSNKDSNFTFIKCQDFVGRNKIGFLVCKNKSRFLIKSSLNQEGNSTSGVSVETVIKGNDSGVFDVGVVDNGGDGVGDLAAGIGGNGKYNGGGGGGGGRGGGGGGGDNGGGDEEDEEFGPLLKFEDVIREAEARGAKLPADIIEAAKSVGIRKLLLMRYLDLQGSAWLGAAMRSSAMLRNRMLADPSFLFKVGTEIVIDTTCATVAEVQKRGKDFWAEFELYAADMLVGVAVNVALVGLLAPYARIGQPSVSQGFVGRFQRAYGALPSSVFEAERPGCRFTLNQRIAAYFYKGILYGFVGFGCGIIGQGIANMIMTAKRSIKKSEDDVPVPPLVKSALLWGVFLGVSSNTRLQVVTGLERLVESSPVGKQFPPVAMAFTVGVRFANNVYAGMQFVDWARWSGVQ
ncbi:protein RETICULATA, chloroplastic [Capsicum annuum]|uniref:protein RETICULATA, chloroplastic n=1 Tax=Capsicum annuum TaxID=4072 RepID=UPI001FB086E5|nr:protein RETICULATA, chloroplastic [Capsicum annuum]